jgi:hypothetical protein
VGDLGTDDSRLINSLPYETFVATLDYVKLGVYDSERIVEAVGVPLEYVQACERYFEEWFGDGGIIDRARDILEDTP